MFGCRVSSKTAKSCVGFDILPRKYPEQINNPQSDIAATVTGRLRTRHNVFDFWDAAAYYARECDLAVARACMIPAKLGDF